VVLGSLSRPAKWTFKSGFLKQIDALNLWYLSVTIKTSSADNSSSSGNTLIAFSRVVFEALSSIMAEAGTPFSRQILEITSASDGGLGPMPPEAMIMGAKPALYRLMAYSVRRLRLSLGLPSGSTNAPNTMIAAKDSWEFVKVRMQFLPFSLWFNDAILEKAQS